MPPQQGVKLGDFFKEVTDSFVATQRALDAKNAEYNLAYRKTLSDAGVNAPPVHLQFRIPTVRAKVNYEFNEEDRTGFSIVLFSKSRDVRERLVQEVEFTLETVPLPRVPHPPEDSPGGPTPSVRRLHTPSGARPRVGVASLTSEDGGGVGTVDRRRVRTLLRATLDHSPDETSSSAAKDLLAAVQLVLEPHGSGTVRATIPHKGRRKEKHYVLKPMRAAPRKGRGKDKAVFSIEPVKVKGD